MAERMRTVFLGTGDIALPSFSLLAGDPGIELVALVTQPDKPAGRHKILKAPRIKQAAGEAGIEVLQPEKSREAIPRLAEIRADLFVVMAYGQILPPALLEMPRLACWNLHASLLPRHRGASPIQAAILSGDAETGVTVMHVARELDAGDVVLAERTPIEPGETGGRLHDRLAGLAPVALARALDLLRRGDPPRQPQQASLVTYLGKLRREDGHLDWTRRSGDLERLVRAFEPWPSTFTTLPDGQHLKVFPPVAVVESEGPPGTILSSGPDGLVVACGGGALRIACVQPEGGRRMPAADFLRGHRLAAGIRFGCA